MGAVFLDLNTPQAALLESNRHHTDALDLKFSVLNPLCFPPVKMSDCTKLQIQDHYHNHANTSEKALQEWIPTLSLVQGHFPLDKKKTLFSTGEPHVSLSTKLAKDDLISSGKDMCCMCLSRYLQIHYWNNLQLFCKRVSPCLFHPGSPEWQPGQGVSCPYLWL